MNQELPVVIALRRAIEAVGSQDKLAALTGIPQGTISRWLSGTVKRLPYDAPAKIEAATNRKVKAREFWA